MKIYSIEVKEKKFNSMEEELSETLNAFLYKKASKENLEYVNDSLLGVLQKWVALEKLQGIKFENKFNQEDASLTIVPNFEFFPIKYPST